MTIWKWTVGFPSCQAQKLEVLIPHEWQKSWSWTSGRKASCVYLSPWAHSATDMCIGKVDSTMYRNMQGCFQMRS
ncbi:hypothetical protein MPTK2_4g08620 [Marchantia polymorpha subsp. ruderalis]